MDEKDTSRFDGQEVPTPRTGLRASNTVATLTPREVLPLQGRGLPPIGYEEDVRKTDWQPENKAQVPYLVEAGQSTQTFASGSFLSNPIALFEYPKSEDREEAYNGQKVTYCSTPDEYRLTRLEEQMDALLDRIALYNVKSSHKI